MKKPIGKLGTTLIILSTIILAGIAIFTAFRLYQLRQESVAPNVPSSFPKAESTTPSTNNCSLSFIIPDAVTPTPTATATPSATPTVTPTATATSTATASATPRITPTATATATSTVASTATPTATPKLTSTVAVTPTPTEAALPVSGTSWPTLFGAGFGILIILGAILLVL